jgi:hypothetical protein
MELLFLMRTVVQSPRLAPTAREELQNDGIRVWGTMRRRHSAQDHRRDDRGVCEPVGGDKPRIKAMNRKNFATHRSALHQPVAFEPRHSVRGARLAWSPAFDRRPFQYAGRPAAGSWTRTRK